MILQVEFSKVVSPIATLAARLFSWGRAACLDALGLAWPEGPTSAQSAAQLIFSSSTSKCRVAARLTANAGGEWGRAFSDSDE